MIPLVGYLDRVSGRPGEQIGVKASSQLGVPYTANLVRIIHADPNPSGTGMKLEDVPCGFAGQYPSRAQPLDLGSHAVVDAILAVPEGGAIRLRVQPGLLAAPQPVLSLGGAVLRVSAAGALLEMDDAVAAAVAAPMLKRCWYELQATFSRGGVRLVQRALQRSWGVDDSGEAAGAAGLPAGGRLLLAADPDVGRFDGRIEDPALLGPDGAPVALWDFSDGIATDAVSGTHPGRLVNLPTRGVRGSRWTGAEMDWKHAPEHYAAIHVP